jgi:hypothetical protein
MKKSKKSATQKKEKRQKTNWPLFFRLCNQGKDNEDIAKALGWHVDPKSADPYKRVRAAKSLARTKGIKVAGKLVRLHDRKLKGAEKPKTDAKKKATSKPRPKPQPKPKQKPETSPTTAQDDRTSIPEKTE